MAASKSTIEFLLFSVVGDYENNPIISAIDRAYRDMAAHTVSVPEGKSKEYLFEKRKAVTELLYKRIKAVGESIENFDEWHKTLSRELKKTYSELTYGQIQKWINMTIKYLVVLSDVGVNGIPPFFVIDNAAFFHAPIDSYVLHYLEVDEVWSTIPTYDRYINIRKRITFMDEYKKWPVFARAINLTKSGEERKADKNTYKRYIQNHPYSFDGKGN